MRVPRTLSRPSRCRCSFHGFAELLGHRACDKSAEDAHHNSPDALPRAFCRVVNLPRRRMLWTAKGVHARTSWSPHLIQHVGVSLVQHQSEMVCCHPRQPCGCSPPRRSKIRRKPVCFQREAHLWFMFQNRFWQRISGQWWPAVWITQRLQSLLCFTCHAGTACRPDDNSPNCTKAKARAALLSNSSSGLCRRRFLLWA